METAWSRNRSKASLAALATPAFAAGFSNAPPQRKAALDPQGHSKVLKFHIDPTDQYNGRIEKHGTGGE
jgi:hypothetical protein